MEAMEAIVVADRNGAKKILLVGFGLGYLALPLVELADVPVAIWDSMPWVAPAERRDRFMRCARKAKICTTEQEVSNELTEDTVVITHNTASDMHYWEIAFCENRFARMNKTNLKAVSQRSVDFLKHLPKLGLVQEHYGLGKHKACVICAAGPSFDPGRVRVMAEAGYPIIAAAQCLEKLNKIGVVPTITVALDPQSLLYDIMKKGTDPGWVYADAMVDPRIWDEYPDKCFAFTVPTAHCHALIWRLIGYDWLEDPCCTVSEGMAQIAAKLGFGAIITTGVDYCADKREGIFKIECDEGKWSWTHYYAGSRSWAWLMQQYQFTWGRLENCTLPPPKQDPIVFPPPSMRTTQMVINTHLKQMLSQQPEEIQARMMQSLPEDVRKDFAPMNPVPVVVRNG